MIRQLRYPWPGCGPLVLASVVAEARVNYRREIVWVCRISVWVMPDTEGDHVQFGAIPVPCRRLGQKKSQPTSRVCCLRDVSCC